MGSGPDSACAAEGAPGGMGVARQRLRDAGEQSLPTSRRLVLAESPLGWGPAPVQPVRPKERNAVRALQGRSRAAQGRVQPLPTGRSPGRVGSPLGWGRAQVQPTRPKAHNAVRASTGRSLATQGRVQPLPTGQRPVLALSLLGWRPAQIQPALLKALQPVKARAVLRRGGSSASCRAKPCSGREPTCVGSSPAPACALEGAPG